jgi:ubiquinone/menaquinone biosynthesis C-methylase UbiE
MQTVLDCSSTFDQELLEIKVKDMYRDVALNPGKEYHFEMGRSLAERLGYPSEILNRLPARSVESFAGVGYFFHLANLKEGERVIDLGSGSGMDSFFASLQVGPLGFVTGLDYTNEQLDKANELAYTSNFWNTRFRKSNIDSLHLDKEETDVVISNGVINLTPDKEKVFSEAARILKPGGRLVISDIVSSVDLPENISCNATLWAACIGGAIQIEKYIGLIEKSGLKVVVVEDNPRYAFISENAKGATRKYGIKSVSILAAK